MSYATPADLLDRFRSDPIAQLAAPEGTRVSGELLRAVVAGDSTDNFTAEEIAAALAAVHRIEKAQADAMELIHSHVSDLYAIPLQPVPLLIVRAECTIAHFYLLGERALVDGTEERDFLQAQKTLQAVRDGKLTLGSAGKPMPATEHVGAEVFGPERLFSRHTLRGL